MLCFMYLFIAFVSVVLAAPALRRAKASTASFAADSSVDFNTILDAAKSPKSKALATFPISEGSGHQVKIYEGLGNSTTEPIFFFTADMDVDCDGVDYKCAHNPDGQSETTFGALAATKVPFFVIPQSFYDKHKSNIKENALGAVICNGKMLYGIFGDTNGDTPQEVIGEASILMAQACFPDDGLDGGTGHGTPDVLYILFGSQVPKGVGKETIDMKALKTLGDKEMQKLIGGMGN